MSRLATLLTMVLVALSLATVGCCDKYKKELVALQQQYNDVQLAKQDLNKSLAECQSTNTELSTELANKDSELVAAKTELDELKAKKPLPRGPVPPGWEKTTGGIKYTLSSDILFGSGRATVSSAGVGKLRGIARTIRSQYAGSLVRVYGYTDGDPIRKSAKLWKDNLDLSANRAMAVTRELRKLGIPAESIEAVAMGQTHPIAPNTTRAGKAKNRRVEVVVVKK